MRTCALGCFLATSMVRFTTSALLSPLAPARVEPLALPRPPPFGSVATVETIRGPLPGGMSVTPFCRDAERTPAIYQADGGSLCAVVRYSLGSDRLMRWAWSG